jgi:hypothetical protein
LTLVLAPAARAAELAELLGAIQKVQAEGQGNDAAQAAWRQLAQQSAEQIPQILAAFEGANPLATNWLAAAVESIAEREFRKGALSAGALEPFVTDRSNPPRARRLAYEWLVRVDPKAPDRLLDGMADDPSLELRRDAVQRIIERANRQYDGQAKDQSLRLYERAMQSARDQEQIKFLVKRLGEMGRTVDLPRHFGFLLRWQLIGPFDNTNTSGYDVAYPPESRIDLAAEIPGKSGAVRWLSHATQDSYGLVDLTKALGTYKGAICYAYTEFDSDREQAVELRLGCVTAWKLWLNGELLFARDEYHRGMMVDQYRTPAKLVGGRNRILLKVCQNEQTEDWAQRWQFQLRVCDSNGTAVRPAAASE